jgi:hypothetical protein
LTLVKDPEPKKADGIAVRLEGGAANQGGAEE